MQESVISLPLGNRRFGSKTNPCCHHALKLRTLIHTVTSPLLACYLTKGMRLRSALGSRTSHIWPLLLFCIVVREQCAQLAAEDGFRDYAKEKWTNRSHLACHLTPEMDLASQISPFRFYSCVLTHKMHFFRVCLVFPHPCHTHTHNTHTHIHTSSSSSSLFSLSPSSSNSSILLPLPHPPPPSSSFWLLRQDLRISRPQALAGLKLRDPSASISASPALGLKPGPSHHPFSASP